MAKTKAPTGVTITRKGDTANNRDSYTCSWKIADKDYADGEACQWRTTYAQYQKVKGKNQLVTYENKWSPITLKNNKVTSTYKYVNRYSWGYLTGKYLKTVEFRIKGNRKKYTTGSGKKQKTHNPTVSAWSPKVFNVYAPPKPTIDTEVGTYPRTTFTIHSTNDNENSQVFTRTEYQSVLIQNASTTDGSKINWNSTTGQRYDTYTYDSTKQVIITEDSGQLNDGKSYTRFFRARSVGPAGNTGWVYSYHTYAMPNRPSITDFTLKDEGATYSLKLNIKTPFSTDRPLKEVRVEYVIADPVFEEYVASEDTEVKEGKTYYTESGGIYTPVVPQAGDNPKTSGWYEKVQVPAHPHAGESWETGATIVTKDDTSGVFFKIDNQVGLDECLFARAVAVYDDFEAEGDAVLIKSGALKKPDNLSVSPGSDNKFTVEADNTSEIDDSYLVVRFFDDQNPNGLDIAILDTSPKVVQCPEYSSSANVALGVYAAAGGTCIENERDDGVTVYSIEPAMRSEVNKSGGVVPLAPTNVTASAGILSGTIRVTWDWSWVGAETAELSWADHEDAWESTDEPQTYSVSRARTSAWNISGLETGKNWYVRVRLISGGDNPTYGAYSDIQTVSLASAPLVPVIDLSTGIITEDGEVTATWGYSTTDGTSQGGAVVAELVNNVYVPIAQLTTQQTYTISAEEQGWQVGETHLLCVSVVSGSGLESDGWSAPVPVTVAQRVTCSISSTSFGSVTEQVEDEDGNTITNTFTALTSMPLSVTVTGAGTAGVTTLIIERASDYTTDLPDEDSFTSYAGDTIYIRSQTGEAPITINTSDLIGRLDDGALYNLVATVQDDLGQSASQTIPFKVIWAHQAEEPTAVVSIDHEKMVAFLTPIAPESYQAGDVCDIYRLSADQPELIYKGAEFGTTYVDPYPTIGEYGGHRFVTRTAEGDYITADNQFAWYDTEDGFEVPYNIINFGEGEAHLTYNASISNEWQKDFEQTAYLGGSVQGDWNKAVRRSSTVTATAVQAIDSDLIEIMRRLATYTGICHVRTKDGSSYAADVQVGDKYNYASGVKNTEYSLKITRVEPEELEGLTYAEWVETEQESE